MTIQTPLDALREVLPLNAATNEDGVLQIGGCDVRELANEYGTPLYIYDEHTIRQTCRDYLHDFQSQMPGARAHYASKAWLSPALVEILVEEGFGLDVVSAGELHVALAGGMEPEQIGFHGNGKTPAELAYALDSGVGRIIVDNDDELALLDELTRSRASEQQIMLRITPGVDAQTHAKTTTGLRDSKFGFPLPSGQAESALVRALEAPFLDVAGFHIHLGSPLFNIEPYADGIATIGEFAAQMKERHGYEWREFSPGGGMALSYTADRTAPTSERYAVKIAEAIHTACDTHGLPMPDVHIEPGRSVVGRAGVALYSVVSRKHIPETRDYVTVDGGMADNIRPAMYDSKYEAAAAEQMHTIPSLTVTVAGKFCESGDVLVRDALLPSLQPGELIAIPASGAYQIAMESNYNLALRPAIVMVRDRQARLVRRRQTLDDLLHLEL
ncbi:MAG: diaminopimelate decarboxylase [Chloroflexi bacterium]|nr:diaminopimelate decarboxylase [Chloroflexota bacterium]MYD17904.1 diaminopimelate decarboxylase [Chloroflexota bacterium]MYJ01044.1 diaminopimelate decarboxylase [Chloroflexota bacterium]